MDFLGFNAVLVKNVILESHHFVSVSTYDLILMQGLHEHEHNGTLAK